MAYNSDRPTILGVRRTALIEIAGYLLVALLLDHFAFGSDRFWNVSPHPFWPLILLMAVQYGTSEALIATALCTVALLAGNMPTQSINQDIYDYLSTVVKHPFMWMIAALVLGEIRMRHVRERDELDEALERSVGKERELAGAFEQVNAVRQSLEGRIAGQMRTGATLYQAARTLDRQDPSEVLLGVVDTVLGILNPKKCSLYLLKEDALEISIGDGWTREDNLDRVFKSTSSLFQEVIGKQRVLCAVNPEDELVLMGQGVLAGPLVDHGTGAVLGMLKIEELGFLDLHFSNIHTFTVLCDWIADSYLSAQQYQEARSAGETEVLTYKGFERQQAYLVGLAIRLHFDLSLIVIRAENPEEIGGRKIASIPGVLYEVSISMLRKSDLLCEYQPGGLHYCLLLPGCTAENASVIAGRLTESLKGPAAARIAPARFQITAQDLHQKTVAKS